MASSITFFTPGQRNPDITFVPAREPGTNNVGNAGNTGNTGNAGNSTSLDHVQLGSEVNEQGESSVEDLTRSLADNFSSTEDQQTRSAHRQSGAPHQLQRDSVAK